MKLALIGKNIQHSKSPEIYKNLIGPHITYDLIDIQQEEDLPSLEELAKSYEGINITAPYKKKYLDKTVIEEAVIDLYSINTISFSEKIMATNTDYYGLKVILPRFKNTKIILIGDGSMARVTRKVIDEFGLDLVAHFYRKKDGDLSHLNLSGISGPVLVINSCSRDFIFEGKLPKEVVFLDYNYNFIPHQYLKDQIVYCDGLELLHLQAKAAVEFWNRTHPKLK